MSRVGIFGGTFDPVHYGHLITAQAVKELRNLDKIIFIPANISPLKEVLPSAAEKHRVKMLQLAIEGLSYFDWSDFEIKKEGVSYTIDTLFEMKKYYEVIELIIGEDNFRTFHLWKSFEEILKLATLLVLRRNVKNNKETGNRAVQTAVFLETPEIDISSTLIRERIKKGLPINFLVPQKVIKYIYKLNLYKE
jgi:nicotinate-nucleotide adenylyltransferase